MKYMKKKVAVKKGSKGPVKVQKMVIKKKKPASKMSKLQKLQSRAKEAAMNGGMKKKKRMMA